VQSPPEPASEELRLAELLAALSLIADLGLGFPPETIARGCLLARRLADELGLPELDARDAFYAALLEHAGCTAYAHELALAVGGDDIAAYGSGAYVDFARPREALAFSLREPGRGLPAPRRARLAGGMVVNGGRIGRALATATCEVGAIVARRLGLPRAVAEALLAMHERWDGKGAPRGLRGEELPIGSRLTRVAETAVLFDVTGGTAAAVIAVRRRAGGMLDPVLAGAFAERAETLLAEIRGGDACRAIVDSEPGAPRLLAQKRLDDVARAFADVADLKAPFLLGHSSGVAELAAAAAGRLGLPAENQREVYLAGLLHDVGRVGVRNGIWEKPAPLTTSEWEAVRLHPYHSERVLSSSPALASLAPLAGMHHERCDGSGYYRGVGADALPVGARVLAAADAYHAMTEPRPYRPALPAEQAGRELRSEASAGRIDADAAAAVLEAAGHSKPSIAHAWPAGLTDREVSVLRLLAMGDSNRDIARTLVISPKTAGHHVEHIYGKIGVSSRAAAALFALEHGLLAR
jgi:HD-GYP domain-containing protein (c-di-GMP phosphodiesterase class II)